jgi:hypothetical protein
MNKKSSFLISLLYLSSCTGFGVYQATFIAATDLIIPNNYVAIEQDYFNDQKYSFAMVKIGNRDAITMVLQSSFEGTYKWVSSEGEIIFTNKAGRITKTVGLSHDVYYMPLAAPELFVLQGPAELDYLIDFKSPELTKIKGIERYSPTLFLMDHTYLSGKDIKVQKTNFLTEVPLISWKAEGYILLSDGQAVASSQLIHPHFPRIDIYFYYKP